MVGVLLNQFGWKGPFVVNGSFMLLMTPLVYTFLPRDSDKPSYKQGKQTSIDIAATTASNEKEDPTTSGDPWWKELVSWKVISLMGCLVLRDSGMYLVLSSYSLWLEQDWDFTAEQAGTASLVISCGEGTAVLMMSLFSDRIGKAE